MTDVPAIEEGKIIEGMVCKITPYGAFVKLPNGKKGLVHISQIDHVFIKDVGDHVKLGEVVKAEVVKIFDDGRTELSIKNTKPKPEKPPQPQRPPQPKPQKPKEEPKDVFRVNPFEDLLNDFNSES